VRIALVVLLSLLLAPVALASEERPTQAELESELVCPTCKSTLDQSNAPVAVRMKAFVRQRIAAGDTKSEIKDQLVAQFGKGVLAAPEREGFDLLAWVLPLAGVAAGIAAVTLLLVRWTRRADEDLPLLE
jgi:cytochrome c-type biogenesis protein CcmH